MNKTDILKGTGVAVVTPFKKSGAIDFDASEKIINHIIDGGCEFLVSLGTTGESPTISKQEKKALIEHTVKVIDGRVPLVIGIGGNNTSDVVLAIHSMPFKGVSAVLSVSPYYNKPPQAGLFEHFKIISESSPVPVILYTVPGRTGSNISAATTLRLAAECPNIIGIKEASGNFDQIYQVLRDRPEGFLVLSGDDSLTMPLLSAGADGVISVTAQAFPKEFSNMVRFGLTGDFTSARKLHFHLLDFMNLLFSDGSPAGIKAALNILQLCENTLRLPLVPASEETTGKLKRSIQTILSTHV